MFVSPCSAALRAASSRARSLTSTAHTHVPGDCTASAHAMGPYPQPRSSSTPSDRWGRGLAQEHLGAAVEPWRENTPASVASVSWRSPTVSSTTSGVALRGGLLLEVLPHRPTVCPRIACAGCRTPSSRPGSSTAAIPTPDERFYVPPRLVTHIDARRDRRGRRALRRAGRHRRRARPHGLVGVALHERAAAASRCSA